MTEKDIFDQEVSTEELENAAGGVGAGMRRRTDCTTSSKRDIQEGGFPNCAATVEDGSYCGYNDACYSHAVRYHDMSSCYKAWE